MNQTAIDSVIHESVNGSGNGGWRRKRRWIHHEAGLGPGVFLLKTLK
jgi:hypothetical protein